MKIIGHRGARGLAPENTIASLKKAINCAADEIEFDLRVTKDHVPILNHNQTLVDASGNKLNVSDSTYLELKAHKPNLATLQEALDATENIPLYIEVKGGEPVEPIANILKTIPANRFCLGSKNQKTLRELHKQMPNVKMVVIESISGIRATHRAKQVDTKTLSMYSRGLWFGFIKAMSARGYELYVYTVNDPKKAQRWAKYGLAGTVTDYPDRFKDF